MEWLAVLNTAQRTSSIIEISPPNLGDGSFRKWYFSAVEGDGTEAKLW